jgi:plasmid stabilization system protein ParE
MNRYQLSHEAQTDLDDILDYLDAQSETASLRVEALLLEGFVFLSLNPGAGHLRQDLND